ncbi:MAG: YicC family protein [Desulfovibrio sp.]|jgi:uncharacterized protein (TIGR00255 family)|nr:YicC family protein [Desulfovibrio sp.]
MTHSKKDTVPRSMTGFGRCLTESCNAIQQWEVKSVNSRHLELKWRLPSFVRGLEQRLEKVVRRHASRGRVEISLKLRAIPNAVSPDIPQAAPDTTPCLSEVSFDALKAAAMLDRLLRMAAARGDAFTPDYNALLHVPALWAGDEEEVDESMTFCLEEGLSLALEDWNESRSAEGLALCTDVHSRILRMEEWTGILAARAPNIREERGTLLRERLGEALADYGRELEESRLLQEIVVLADRLDVSEELTRLDTHLNRLRELMQNGGDAGRRLDFTLQECFREINTCGAKLPDVQLSRLVVDFKNELEKCREQVQNLE